MEGYVNENRWIDLSGLPHFNGGCSLINWAKCAGHKVPFKYDNVVGEINILTYRQHPRYSKALLTIYIEKYTEEPIEVDASYFTHCRLRALVSNKIIDVRPDLVVYLKDKRDAYRYSTGSDKEVDVVCPICGYERRVKVVNLRKYGFVCHLCGDGVSYPEKFIVSMLTQLKIDYIKEASKKNPGFEWAKKYRYDFTFCINGRKYILESDGGYHRYSDQQIRDANKTLLAEQHGFTIIRVNCNYNDNDRFDFVRSNILSSQLADILPLNNVNWDTCNKYAISSLMHRACELWEYNLYSLCEIQAELHISKSSVWNYLKLGKQVGLCPSYTHSEARKRGNIIPVACYIDKQIYKIFYGAEEVVQYFWDVHNIQLSIYQVWARCKSSNNRYEQYSFRYATRNEYLQYKMTEKNIKFEVVKGADKI